MSDRQWWFRKTQYKFDFFFFFNKSSNGGLQRGRTCPAEASGKFLEMQHLGGGIILSSCSSGCPEGEGKVTKRTTGSPLVKATCKEDWERRRGSHWLTVSVQPFPAGHLQQGLIKKLNTSMPCHHSVPSLPQNQPPGLSKSPGDLQIPRDLLRLV